MDYADMEDYILKTRYTVTTADADMEGRLRPGALVNYLVQSAIQSAEELGFGFDVLQQQQIFWVLHRLTVQVETVVRWNDRVVVETWPKTIDGLLYLRDFLIRGESERIVARSTSGWLAVHRSSKRPGLVSTLHPEKFSALKETHAIHELPEKLESAEAEKYSILQPVYSDFDINHHVTTTRYVDWMMDSLDIDFMLQHYPKRFSVNFLKEILPSDTIALRKKHEANTWYFEGTNTVSGKSSFRGAFEF